MSLFPHLRAMKIHMLTPMREIRMQSQVMLLGKSHALMKRLGRGVKKNFRHLKSA